MKISYVQIPLSSSKNFAIASPANEGLEEKKGRTHPNDDSHAESPPCRISSSVHRLHSPRSLLQVARPLSSTAAPPSRAHIRNAFRRSPFRCVLMASSSHDSDDLREVGFAAWAHRWWGAGKSQCRLKLVFMSNDNFSCFGSRTHKLLDRFSLPSFDSCRFVQ